MKKKRTQLRQQVVCAHCGREFSAVNVDIAQFCSAKCKMLAWEARWDKAALREHRRVKAAQWRAKNHDKVKAATLRWYYNNRDRGIATSRKWKAANHDRVSAYTKNRIAALRAADPEFTKKNWKAWREKHPEAEYHARHRRYARHRNAAGRASTKAIQARLDYYGRLCWICSAPMQAIDHVKPLAKGGSNWPANLRPICKPCNQRKRDIWPYDRSMGFLKLTNGKTQ